MDPTRAEVESPEFNPRDVEHIYLHYPEYIFHPPVAGVWSQEYAEQVAGFITSRAAESTSLSQRAISQLVLSPDWSEGRDGTILSDLHLAEAEVRGVTPWTMQQVLWMQANLNSNGEESASLVGQRTRIIGRLGEIRDGPVSLPEIGAKVQGLGLCINEVMILENISGNTAAEGSQDRISPPMDRQLQDYMTSEFGQKYYEAGLMFQTGSRQGDSAVAEQGSRRFSDVFSRAMESKQNFMANIPVEMQKAYVSDTIRQNLTLSRRQLSEYVKGLKGKAGRGLGLLKNRLSRNKS